MKEKSDMNSAKLPTCDATVAVSGTRSTRSSNGRKASSDLPMKLRRRQSDARWRANVASCYETLKNIIPINKLASRRQISKV